MKLLYGGRNLGEETRREHEIGSVGHPADGLGTFAVVFWSAHPYVGPGPACCDAQAGDGRNEIVLRAGRSEWNRAGHADAGTP